MKDKRIHAALSAKVSYERVGIEVLKMMNSPNPLTAFQLIYEMDLYSIMFLYPTGQLRQTLTNSLPH
jgi:tRNA nucleotidyltransferase (CCA-adding enzyme)